MDEGTNNLVQTCDAFVQVMDEIMELSEATHMFAVASNRVGDSFNDMQGGGSRRSARRSRDICDMILISQLWSSTGLSSYLARFKIYGGFKPRLN